MSDVHFFRRQKQIVAEQLFEIATSGDKDELFRLLEDGDDVNPQVWKPPPPLLVMLVALHVLTRMRHQIGPC